MLSRADLALLLVSAIWGTTFALLRDSLRVIDPAELMAIRFTLAAFVLAAILPRGLRRATGRRTLRDGAWLGGWLAAGYLTQVIGLATITAARSAFLTSTYVLFTPFLAIPFGAAHPVLGDLLGVALGFGGIMLFSADAGFSLRPGDLWTLGCAVSFGIQIVLTNRFAKRNDPVALSLVQIAAGAAVGWMVVVGRGGVHTPLARIPWGVLIYLAVVATALVIVIQTWALTRTTPVRAAILFTTEPIFAALFAMAFFDETMTAREVLGGALILAGVVLTIVWRPGRRAITAGTG